MISDPVKLLWTGGWDSTFRLLWLVLVEQRPVQPIYLIDASRNSIGMELRAMSMIRRQLAEQHPEAMARLRSVQIADIADLPPDSSIRKSIAKLIGDGWLLAPQHAWIAEYCRANRLNAVELSEERSIDPAPDGCFSRMAIPWLDMDESPARFRPDAPAELLDLFGNLCFPLVSLTKAEMLALANEHGFADLMTLTWFCHHPAGRKPCGACGPCRHAIKEGFGFRIPRSGHLRHRLHGLRKFAASLIGKKTP
jgi:hypothetical protein